MWRNGSNEINTDLHFSLTEDKIISVLGSGIIIMIVICLIFRSSLPVYVCVCTVCVFEKEKGSVHVQIFRHFPLLLFAWKHFLDHTNSTFCHLWDIRKSFVSSPGCCSMLPDHFVSKRPPKKIPLDCSIRNKSNRVTLLLYK